MSLHVSKVVLQSSCSSFSPEINFFASVIKESVVSVDCQNPCRLLHRQMNLQTTHRLIMLNVLMVHQPLLYASEVKFLGIAYCWETDWNMAVLTFDSVNL